MIESYTTIDIPGGKNQPPWRKLPPVNLAAVEMTIGRNHLPINGLKNDREFLAEHFALARQLLEYKQP